MKKAAIITFTACCIAVFVSCQSTVNTVENKEKTMKPTKVDTSKISTDSFLRRRLKFTSVNKLEQPDGLFRVQIAAQNTRVGIMDQISTWFMGDNPYQIEYRFTWLDKNGMEVKTAAGTWIPVSIVPGDTVRFNAVAPNPSCKDFLLSIRENISARNR